jgi:cell division protein ZapA
VPGLCLAQKVHTNEGWVPRPNPLTAMAALRELAKLLDTEVSRIKTSVGSVGDIRLLVMAGLMVADRLSESILKIEDLEDQVRGLKETRAAGLEDMRLLEQKVSTKLDLASMQLERLAKALDGG